MLETEGALPPARRRRRRPRKVAVSEAPTAVTVSVVTVIRADQPFDSEAEADAWLTKLDDSDYTGGLLDDAIGALDRVRAAEASTSGLAFGTQTTLEDMISAKAGYGAGDQVASGRFIVALELDARGGTGSRKRDLAARTRAPGRTASILGGREKSSACEVLIPRVRMDLDLGNEAAASVAIAPAVRATIDELEFAVEDTDHEKDLDRLEELLPILNALEASTDEEPDQSRIGTFEEALTIAERVIRRRRILDQ